MVQAVHNPYQIRIGDGCKIPVLRDILPDQAIHVFVSGGITTLCVLCLGAGAIGNLISPQSTPTVEATVITTEIVEGVLIPVITATFPPTETTIPTIPPTSVPTLATFLPAGAGCVPIGNGEEEAIVTRVVDGDTIEVSMGGELYKVRYIGMDTPEDTTEHELFGPEATAKNSELVAGKTITMIKDVSETDKYDRLLRYVFADGVFVNCKLVESGFANVATYPPDVSCVETFRQVEDEAKAALMGLWAPVAIPTAAPTLKPTVAPTQKPPAPTAKIKPSPTPKPASNAGCNCAGPDLDCKDFKTHKAAQACYTYCGSQGYGDVFRLDGDHDGHACESLP